MNKQEILAKLKEAIVADLHLEDVTVDDIAEDTRLFGAGLELDSIDAVELVVIVEKYFQVAITDAKEAKEAFATMGVLADFILARMRAA